MGGKILLPSSPEVFRRFPVALESFFSGTLCCGSRKLDHHSFQALLIGGGDWTRTNDLRIMSRPELTDSKEIPHLPPAESGKVLQNPQPPATKILPRRDQTR